MTGSKRKGVKKSKRKWLVISEKIAYRGEVDTPVRIRVPLTGGDLKPNFLNKDFFILSKSAILILFVDSSHKLLCSK